jgi:hypothetical protein
LRVVLRADFAAAVERLAAGLRAVDARAAPLVADLVRVDAAFFAVLPRFAVVRFAVERLAVALRAPPVRREADAVEPLLALPSTVHLPDITRCAASATASAISEPSLVALAIILLAA